MRRCQDCGNLTASRVCLSCEASAARLAALARLAAGVTYHHRDGAEDGAYRRRRVIANRRAATMELGR